MKKLVMLILLATVAFAQPTDWFQSSFARVGVNVSSSINVVPQGPNPFVQYVRADVVFVPQNSEFVAVRELSTFPSARVTGDRARFEWVAPPVGELPYRYEAVVDVANNVPRVRARIPFPVEPPVGFEQYVASTKHIDARHPAVVQQARVLAQGEDDLFSVVNKIAIWVKANVEYDLSTLTADVSQPASWVLANRQGVCDEITSLFVAMLRSLDIPARFVSGLAYTSNPAFPNEWGAHGWAEVYFPGVGWVPFDPTFGELAWVDPGHIKLKESLDPQEPTTVFEWKSRDASVEVSDLELSAGVIETQGSEPFELAMGVSPVKPRVGFGSFNAVMVEVENLADYYVAYELLLTRVSDLEIVGGTARHVVLPPGGRERVFWKVKVRDDLDPGFQYEIPVQVYSLRNDSVRVGFVAGSTDPVFSEASIDSAIEQLQLSVVDPFDVACAFENDFVWEEYGVLNCRVRNREPTERAVNVCFQDCEPVLLPPESFVPVSFRVPAPEFGANDAEVVVSDGPLVKRAVLSLVRLDEPRVIVKDVELPESVSYGETFTLAFTLSRDSVSFPQKVSVEVTGGGAKAEVDVGELTVDQAVTINVRSDQLYSGSPEFDIDVDFRDTRDRGYSTSREVSMDIVGVPLWKRVVGFFVDLF